MKTVLIVDDAPAVLAALVHLFKLRRYAVLAANNGFEALSIATTQPFDAALVDVNMPGMDGYTVCQKLCELMKSQRRNAPVLMMTGCYSTEGSNLAAAAGAVALLRKPFDIFALLNTVDSLLGGQNSPAAQESPRNAPPGIDGRDTPSIFGWAPSAVRTPDSGGATLANESAPAAAGGASHSTAPVDSLRRPS